MLDIAILIVLVIIGFVEVALLITIAYTLFRISNILSRKQKDRKHPHTKP